MSWKPKKGKNKGEHHTGSQYSPFQIQRSNFNPRMKILLFLDSGKAGLLENVQNHFSKYFGSREISKTKEGTFF